MFKIDLTSFIISFVVWLFAGAILGGIIHNLNAKLIGTEYLADNWNYDIHRKQIKTKRTWINYVLHFLEVMLLAPLLIMAKLNTKKEAAKTIRDIIVAIPIAYFCAVVLYFLTMLAINYFMHK